MGQFIISYTTYGPQSPSTGNAKEAKPKCIKGFESMSPVERVFKADTGCANASKTCKRKGPKER